MTAEKKKSIADKIVSILIENGVCYGEDKESRNAVDQIVLMYDRLLYEADGKKIDYETYRKIFKMFNNDWADGLNYREAAELFNVPFATVYQIAKGKYWV